MGKIWDNCGNAIFICQRVKLRRRRSIVLISHVSWISAKTILLAVCKLELCFEFLAEFWRVWLKLTRQFGANASCQFSCGLLCHIPHPSSANASWPHFNRPHVTSGYFKGSTQVWPIKTQYCCLVERWKAIWNNGSKRSSFDRGFLYFSAYLLARLHNRWRT